MSSEGVGESAAMACSTVSMNAFIWQVMLRDSLKPLTGVLSVEGSRTAGELATFKTLLRASFYK